METMPPTPASIQPRVRCFMLKPLYLRVGKCFPPSWKGTTCGRIAKIPGPGFGLPGSDPRGEANSRIQPAPTGARIGLSLDRLGGLARSPRGEDLDRPDVHHLEEPVATQLAADAAVLDAPEWHPRIRLHDAVHEHHAGFDLPHESFGPLEVPGPQACAQSELGIVRFAHRGVEVSHREDRCDGTERLFLQHPHRPRHPTEYGGLVEPTGTGDSFSTDFDAGPFADRILHLTLDLLPLGLVDQRSNVRRRTEGIPDTEGSNLLHEPRGELLGDGVHDEEPLGGDARLPCVHEAAGDCPLDRKSTRLNSSH